jgi:ribonuclease BN (tRNA processing enzyme)
MEFSALPVKKGDAFLLNFKGIFILVDGGVNQEHICSLLSQENIPDKRIHIIICTHYDADHINGILGILKSNKWKFNEIWLPEILGSIGYTISKSHRKWLNALRKFREISVGESINSSDLPYVDKDNNEDVSIASLNLFLNFRFFYYQQHPSWVYDEPEIDNDGEIITNLHSACSMVKNSLSSGAYVRWFKYKNAEQSIDCGNNMIAINSIETGVTIYDPIQLAKALLLTTINKESLVFLFNHNHFPNVLFAADSDLKFSKSISLKDNSIVTAPHHGSDENKKAYSIIVGKNLCFVRSDSFNNTRPCNTYIDQLNRYCTRCRNASNEQKVILEFDGNSMSPTNGTNPCTCQKV